MSGDKGADGTTVSPTFSVTKTLGALLTGTVMYQTRELAPATRSPNRVRCSSSTAWTSGWKTSTSTPMR